MPLEDIQATLRLTAAIGLILFALRCAWALIARRYGFWHPTHDWFWPRLPWRPIWRAWAQLLDWFEEVFSMGGKQTAGWLSVASSLCLQFKDGDVLLGRVRHWLGGWVQPMGMKPQRHMMMIAGTGSGKSVFLASQLAVLNSSTSAFAIDPKGTLATTILPSQVRNGRTAHVLDPLRITKQQSASWDPLHELVALNARIGEDVSTLYLDKIAEACVEKHPSEKPFWPESARLIWSSILGHVLTTEPSERRNIVRARELVSVGYRELSDDPQEALDFLWIAMRDNPAFSGHVAKGGAFMLGASANGADDVLATLRAATKFLDHPQVRAISRNSTFNLCDLKGGADWVVCVAPTTEIRGALRPWFRLLTMSALYGFEMIPGGLENPSLFAIDEMPSLGNMPDVEAALAVMRGYGVRFLGVAQDIGNLKQAYPTSWASFIGNADAVFWMGVNHPSTADFLSQQLGKATRKEKTGRGKNKHQFVNEREVMTPDQVRRFLNPKRGNMIVTRFGERPIRARLMPYYKELPVWLYEPDPEHREETPRAQFRSWLRGQHFAVPRFSGPVFSRRMSEADARALFGITGHYTPSDLDQRSQLLRDRFAPEIVASARRILMARL
ncbi:hypothetical protein PB2503_05797 [Parvularcula bermudensis HTCC2503]|uniref:Uncharacterized protein n=1 Tax=Parvularcula bermudensis (strain ATCC BAA-594 / HTCC2503 / KCTC 12087) TaxID=314260 RepID=E0TGZ0_PARBH|nr:type IV secretory system conjugative DNA transfer family protein [Parvularcula bermudensis]ADM09230.1 hypothetical protein PB2503_05797 [Parvularcula bermudensis HTCC2503]